MVKRSIPDPGFFFWGIGSGSANLPASIINGVIDIFLGRFPVEKLPPTSIIMCFTNEAWSTLVRKTLSLTIDNFRK